MNPPRPLPLTGYRVLDLTLARAGPTAVRLLADWGADVIRIEVPAEPGQDKQGFTGSRRGADYQNLHRNKRSLSLNLKAQEGRQLFYELVGKSDFLIENFRSDVKHRLGIDYDSVRAVNPAIIYGSISGFGQDGPYSDRPGVDQITQGTSGLMSITGEPDQGPMRVGVAISDTSAGMFLGQGLLLALLHRLQTGEGQWVHTSLLEAMLCKLDFQGARYTMSGEIPGREGNHHPTNVPMGVYEASDGLVNLAASSSRMFRSFCEVIGAPELLDDPMFASAGNRVRHRAVVQARLNDITRRRSVAYLVERLNAVGVPCGPIYNIREAFEDPQAKHLKMVKPAIHRELGPLNLIRSPINMSAFPQADTFDRAGPDLGEHSREILLELGLDAARIEHLESIGAI